MYVCLCICVCMYISFLCIHCKCGYIICIYIYVIMYIVCVGIYVCRFMHACMYAYVFMNIVIYIAPYKNLTKVLNNYHFVSLVLKDDQRSLFKARKYLVVHLSLCMKYRMHVT